MQPEYANADELRSVLSEQTETPVLSTGRLRTGEIDKGKPPGSPQMDRLLAQALLAEGRHDVSALARICSALCLEAGSAAESILS